MERNTHTAGPLRTLAAGAGSLCPLAEPEARAGDIPLEESSKSVALPAVCSTIMRWTTMAEGAGGHTMLVDGVRTVQCDRNKRAGACGQDRLTASVNATEVP
jgi:hypothetical protein